MTERKVSVVFCKQGCDIVCESDYFNIFIPTHDDDLIYKYFDTSDLTILFIHKTRYYEECETKEFNNLMADRRIALLEL